MEGFRTNKDLFLILRNAKRDIGDYLYLKEKIEERMNISSKKSEELKIKLRKFASKLKEKWIKCSYSETYFFKHHNQWLERDFSYPNEILTDTFSTSAQELRSSIVTVYKAKGSLLQYSDREQIRRAQYLINHFTSSELLNAAGMKLRKRGMHSKACLLRYLANDKYNKIIENLNKRIYSQRQKVLPIKGMKYFRDGRTIPVHHNKESSNNT